MCSCNHTLYLHEKPGREIQTHMLLCIAVNIFHVDFSPCMLTPVNPVDLRGTWVLQIFWNFHLLFISACWFMNTRVHRFSIATVVIPLIVNEFFPYVMFLSLATCYLYWPHYIRIIHVMNTFQQYSNFRKYSRNIIFFVALIIFTLLDKEQQSEEK